MELILLKDIVIIFALSIFVNLIFNKIKVPTVVGYLLTGIVAGPHLLAIIHAEHEIELLAEIGVVLLLFTIGMEFSLKHLLKIRRIVFLGGLLQVVITAGVFYVAGFFYNLNWQSGLFIGFLAALSSSALVLKLLQERSELTSNFGRTILGILIFQDLLLVPLLLFTELLNANEINFLSEVFILTFKAVLIIGVVYVGNKWLLPKLLYYIALTKNQELFLMSIFLICLAIAILTSQLGMSLAFGAFLAGLMISESPYSHNAFSNLIPFKDIFTSFFFVSIGMLLDLNFIINNYQLVVISVILVILLKSIIAGGTGFILGHTFKGAVLVGLALSQVGEFSFILAKIGLNSAIISQKYYQLFLSVAVISMAITPFLLKGAKPLTDWILKFDLPKFIVDGLFPLKEIEIPQMSNHIVIIGKDPVALKLSAMAYYNNLKHISVIFDPLIAKEKIDRGEWVIYGDAVNEPILSKAYVHTADIVLISVGNLIPAMAIIEKVRQLNKNAYIIARAKFIKNVEDLYRLGADQVLPEKLEIAIDIYNRVLIKRMFPNDEIRKILTQLRSMHLGIFTKKDIINKPSAFDEFPQMNIQEVKLEKNTNVNGMNVVDIQLRNRTGVTLLAIKRNNEIIEHPGKEVSFNVGDVLYIMGEPEQIELAVRFLNAPS